MNLLKKSLLCILGGLTVILLIFSCKKELAQNTLTTKADLPYYPRVGSFRSLTMPTVEDDMLVFTDGEHFDAYLAYLDAIVMDEPQSEEEEDTDATEIDDKLLVVEQALGFQSLRAKLKADFDALDEQGFASLDEIPKEYYIASSSYRSVFNEDQEVKIGNVIWVYYNADFMVEITNGSLEIRNLIRTVRGDSPDFLPTPLHLLDPVKITPLDKMTDFVVGSGDETSGDGGEPKCNFGTRYCYPIPDLNSFDACNPLTRYIWIQSGVTCNSGSSSAYEDPWDSPIQVTINWGDGSSETIQIINGWGKDDPNIQSRPHTYAAPGNYTISVSGFKVDDQSALSTNPGQLGIAITNSCFPDQASSPRVWKYSVETGSQRRAYSSELVKTNVAGNSPWGKARVCAVTQSYEWKNGTWKSKKVDRLASIFNAAHRGNVDDCTIYRTQVKSVWPYNSKKAEAVGTENYKHFTTGDIYSDQRMYHNGNTYQHFHTLADPGC